MADPTRHLVKDRLDITGARRSHAGAEAVLVAGNTGARTAGVDRATVRSIIERVGVEVFLEELREQLRQQTFRGRFPNTAGSCGVRVSRPWPTVWSRLR